MTEKGKTTTLVSDAMLIPSVASLFILIAHQFGLNLDEQTVSAVIGAIVGIIVAYFDIKNPECQINKISVGTYNKDDIIVEHEEKQDITINTSDDTEINENRTEPLLINNTEDEGQ